MHSLHKKELELWMHEDLLGLGFSERWRPFSEPGELMARALGDHSLPSCSGLPPICPFPSWCGFRPFRVKAGNQGLKEEGRRELNPLDE